MNYYYYFIIIIIIIIIINLGNSQKTIAFFLQVNVHRF
jgi:hypothetical protein